MLLLQVPRKMVMITVTKTLEKETEDIMETLIQELLMGTQMGTSIQETSTVSEMGT